MKQQQFIEETNKLEKILKGLHDYTKMHFDEEVNLMKSLDYPRLHLHIAAHKGFVDKLDSFKIDFEKISLGTQDQVISELIETNLITAHTTLNRTQLTITQEGKDSLGYFEGRIGEAIKSEIKEYFKWVGSTTREFLQSPR